MFYMLLKLVQNQSVLTTTFLFQLPVADPFLEKVNISDLGEYWGHVIISLLYIKQIYFTFMLRKYKSNALICFFVQRVLEAQCLATISLSSRNKLAMVRVMYNWRHWTFVAYSRNLQYHRKNSIGRFASPFREITLAGKCFSQQLPRCVTCNTVL